MGVELLIVRGSLPGYQQLLNSEYHTIVAGVRLWGISFMVERETAQTAV